MYYNLCTGHKAGRFSKSSSLRFLSFCSVLWSVLLFLEGHNMKGYNMTASEIINSVIRSYISHSSPKSMHYRVCRNERIFSCNCRNRAKAESRLPYRLKKWFMGLRPVNNWLWRKMNKDDQAYCTTIVDAEMAQNGTLYFVYHEIYLNKLFPDYKSIKRLQ